MKILFSVLTLLVFVSPFAKPDRVVLMDGSTTSGPCPRC